MKVGFIGLGIMGRPMAKNLLKKKDQPGSELLVSDLNKEAVADVVAAGAREATYAEIGAECSNEARLRKGRAYSLDKELLEDFYAFLFRLPDWAMKAAF